MIPSACGTRCPGQVPCVRRLRIAEAEGGPKVLAGFFDIADECSIWPPLVGRSPGADNQGVPAHVRFGIKVNQGLAEGRAGSKGGHREAEMLAVARADVVGRMTRSDGTAFL